VRLGRLAPTRRERGQVVVLFALLLPVILGIGSVVVTIGNWYVHKKHLQTLVDAGAFAGGTQFTGCFQDSVGTNNRVKLAALKYAGDPTRDATTENRQLEDPQDAHVVLNSANYWPGAGTATDGTGYDYTNVSTAADAPKLGQPGGPCYNGYLDVKATEDKVPLLFKWLPASPSPKSKARIEIREAAGESGLFPVAVPEVLPDKVAALFVNEATGNIVGGANLNAATIPGLSAFSMYQGDVGGVNLGVSGQYNIVIVSSRDSSFVAPTSGTLASVCNANTVQILCYGTPWSSTSNRVYTIWAYQGGGSGGLNPPTLRQVELSGGCPTDQSAPYFNLDAGCSIAVSASIDYGQGGGNPAPYPTCATTGTVKVNGSNMTWGAYPGDPNGRWTGSITPATGSGRTNVTISWQTDQGGGNCGGQKWSGSFTANAVYAGNTNSGPVQYLTATDNATGLAAGSINKTSSASIHVTVGLLAPLIEASALAAPIAMRFGSAAGSLNQALDCDKNVTFRDELLNNCQNPYRTNKRNGSCAGYGTGNLPQAPIGPLPGDDCIVTETGDKSGQIRQAMNDRWGKGSGPTCQTLNHWPNTQAELDLNGMPDPLTDPRFVTIFVTDESAFGGSGNTIYPVRRFAGFYITSADGLNCPGDVPANPGNKNMWGHFVSYVLPTSGGIPDTTLCKFSSGNVCVPVLTE
jgi:putative Flp pilus-assembly TadE/G-like protein